MVPATYRFGEFTFDCGSRLLTRGGAKKHLSPKAQQLLELLLAARPRVLSRETLYDEIWPSTFVCETNLASIVNEVRRALGDNVRASRYIRTVHGFGYAFCGEAATSVDRPPVTAMLLCGERRHFLREGENSVGRGQDCQVVMPEATISRRHALITVYDDTASISDLDSKNGTSVDGRPIGRSPVPVTSTSRIAFGSMGASIVFLKTSTESLQLNMGEVRRQVEESLRV